MERLTAGESVTIRSDLEIGKSYGLTFVKSMEPYRGLETRIIYVYEDNYDLEIDEGKHGWTDKMFRSRLPSSHP
jgi:hypothetical protein